MVKHDWLKNRTVPISIFKNLILLSGKNKNYDFRVVKPFWGQKLVRGKSKLKKVSLPNRLKTNFAEFYGILLGDCCITSDLKGFSITGDKYLDYYYYFDYLNSLIKTLFKISPKIYQNKNERVVRCIVYGKSVVKYLIDAGFPIGVKYTKNPKILLTFFAKRNFWRLV